MRPLTAPLFFIGRISLWILFFPIGIWRSLVHHRKKARRQAVADLRREMKNG